MLLTFNSTDQNLVNKTKQYYTLGLDMGPFSKLGQSINWWALKDNGVLESI